jgi:phage terminase large subunit
MFRSLVDGKNICAVIHRRAGKDIFCVDAWVIRGLQRKGTHVYLFPLQKQAREVIWEGMDFDGNPFLSGIPDHLIVKKNQARMSIELFNGSKLILAGSNNYNGLMGTNPVTIIYSEFSLHNPLARQYLNPILVQNKGIEILQFTPRGQNHAYEAFNTVKDDPTYHTEHLSIEQTFRHDGKTRIITAEDLKRSKSLGMSDEMVRQEFYVDFEVGNLGAYYTREMSDLEREGRYCGLRINPHLPLHSIWDLGGTDATAGALFQIEGRFIHIHHVLHDTGLGLKYYLDEAEKFRQSIGCPWGSHWMPHDSKQEHQGWEHTESRITQARKAGWHLNIVPKVNFIDGIEAVRYMFPRVRINKNVPTTSILMRALREYQRKFIEGRGIFSKQPLENWSVHLADMFRYLAVNYRRLYDIPQAASKYSTNQ